MAIISRLTQQPFDIADFAVESTAWDEVPICICRAKKHIPRPRNGEFSPINTRHFRLYEQPVLQALLLCPLFYAVLHKSL
jgi:hypothetical protein